jgi:hypothetical protein
MSSKKDFEKFYQKMVDEGNKKYGKNIFDNYTPNISGVSYWENTGGIAGHYYSTNYHSYSSGGSYNQYGGSNTYSSPSINTTISTIGISRPY